MDLVQGLAEVQLSREACENAGVETVLSCQIGIRIGDDFFECQNAGLGQRQLRDYITVASLEKQVPNNVQSGETTNLSSCRQLQKAYTSWLSLSV